MQNQYQFIPTFSLTPNKIVSFNTVFRYSDRLKEYQHISKTRQSNYTIIDGKLIKETIKRSSHNLKISDNAYRTLQNKINWLYYLATPKKVKTYHNALIFNFKINFITLTLPSKQLKCTSETTNELLNQFITEIRAKFNVVNYVWRLEFQKNGNVHYHIVTDTYIDFFHLRSIWNRIIAKHGYIKAYQDKMNGLTLLDYHKLYNYNNKVTFKENSLRYAKGVQCQWTKPPTVDVKSVISNKAISSYISKYFSKDNNNNIIMNELDNDSNTKNMRLWFCSRSLSKLKTVSEYTEAYKFDIFGIISQAKDYFLFKTKYADIINFRIDSMIGNARKWIDYILKKYAINLGYCPWGVDILRGSP
jgi:uncharacterized protein YfkK (UPF0435 family)